MSSTTTPTRIFLVALHPSDVFPFIGESQGICAISGYLQAHFDGVEVSLFDLQVDPLDRIIEAVERLRPEVIGVSVKMLTFDRFGEFYRLLAARVFPGYRPMVVVGNSLPHFSGRELLTDHYPDVIVSRGEGEVTFGDLCEYFGGYRVFGDVRNIQYLKDGQVVSTAYCRLAKESIPAADRRYSQSYHRKGGEVYIEASRGCAYCGCSICECREFLGAVHKAQRWRDRPVGAVVEELKLLMAQGIDVVTFSDEDFFGTDEYGLQRAALLADEIVAAGIRIGFRVNARVKSIFNAGDSERFRRFRLAVLGKLQRAGLCKLFLGFESGSPTQLRRYNKGFSLDEFLQAKAILTQAGVDFELGFISLDPLMNLEELCESLRFIGTHGCIPAISSVYKELRVQRGNVSYLGRVRTYESAAGVELLGPLNFNEQVYPVIRYADKRVQKLNALMSGYEQATYKLYYALRIQTQYAEREGDRSVIGSIYRAIGLLKQIDYRLMVSLAEKIGRNQSGKVLQVQLDAAAGERKAVYTGLDGLLEKESPEKYAALREVIRATYSLE